MDLHTDFPQRIKSGRKVLIGEKHQPLTFDTVRPHADGLLVSFRGVDTPEDASKLRNQWVYVKATEVPPLPEGKHYQYEMIGLDVVDENEIRWESWLKYWKLARTMSMSFGMTLAKRYFCPPSPRSF